MFGFGLLFFGLVGFFCLFWFLFCGSVFVGFFCLVFV